MSMLSATPEHMQQQDWVGIKTAPNLLMPIRYGLWSSWCALVVLTWAATACCSI